MKRIIIICITFCISSYSFALNTINHSLYGGLKAQSNSYYGFGVQYILLHQAGDCGFYRKYLLNVNVLNNGFDDRFLQVGVHKSLFTKNSYCENFHFHFQKVSSRSISHDVHSIIGVQSILLPNFSLVHEFGLLYQIHVKKHFSCGLILKYGLSVAKNYSNYISVDVVLRLFDIEK